MDMTDLTALLGEDITAENYSDLWVALPDLTAAPLLGEARRLADSLGCYVHAVVQDESLGEQAIAFGADRVHVAPDIAEFLARQQPEFIFFPVTHAAPAAQLAQRMRAGLVTDARNLSTSGDSSRSLLGSHPVYGGDYLMDIAIHSPVKMATLDPRVLPPPYPDASRVGKIIPADSPAPEPRVRDHGIVDYTPYPWRPLTKVKVIVSAGSGVRDAGGFALVKQLAERLGAQLAGDRSARDFGWVDEAHEVGLTGQEVAPDLYLAVGIRGDTIHNAAIVGARQVVAIHSNPEAPIFSVADYGVVASPKDFLPKLLAHLA